MCVFTINETIWKGRLIAGSGERVGGNSTVLWTFYLNYPPQQVITCFIFEKKSGSWQPFWSLVAEIQIFMLQLFKKQRTKQPFFQWEKKKNEIKNWCLWKVMIRITLCGKDFHKTRRHNPKQCTNILHFNRFQGCWFIYMSRTIVFGSFAAIVLFKVQ